ncbi:energy transducer TonB [Candidatus Poribacteria bacterium]|nr:energy transducer TonB [Candidatus Poribacteria bacterium]MYA58140.1 energy transducer TonB [Candidatus Poribacteria bacterium]
MRTITDVQRQNREAAQQRKKKAIRIAWSFAIGLHVIGIIAGGIYFIQKTVLEMHKDKVESVVLEAEKPQPKRRTPPRVARKPQKPKFSKVRAPKGQAVTTSAKIPMGNARFTLPASDVSTRPVMAPSTTGIGKNLFRATRQQASIVTTMPKFEVPKFESTSLVTRIDMGTSLAQTEFSDPGNLELASVNLGDAKQSFNEFLKAVRDRIKQVQRFPPRVRNLDEGASTTVRFTLFKDGTIRNPAVTDSSGSTTLDNAAIAAVQNAVPYPPFPEGQEGNSLRLELPIIFELSN